MVEAMSFKCICSLLVNILLNSKFLLVTTYNRGEIAVSVIFIHDTFICTANRVNTLSLGIGLKDRFKLEIECALHLRHVQ